MNLIDAFIGIFIALAVAGVVWIYEPAEGLITLPWLLFALAVFAGVMCLIKWSMGRKG
jgi:uncharacterized membrane protein HdeD (DUF308 family)